MCDRKMSIACVTSGLDWSHRQRTSNEDYDSGRAIEYVKEHVASTLARAEAARAGADIILCPEYFAGTELFTTGSASRRKLLADTWPEILRLLKGEAALHNTALACSLDLDHGDLMVQTGIIVTPDGLVSTQIKNTALPPGNSRAPGYSLLNVHGIKTGVFTCSDLTSFPEDPIALARQGMELVLVPGCGFANTYWCDYLRVRALDLGCVVAYADSDRAAIVDCQGCFHARTEVADTWILAQLEVPERPPVERLYSWFGRRDFSGFQS